jgi:hypothetical protein
MTINFDEVSGSDFRREALTALSDVRDMTFDEFEAAIKAAVSKLLARIKAEDAPAVHVIAKQIAGGIAHERGERDPDMTSVVRRLDAMLEPLIGWLTGHGIDCRSLRAPN